MLNKKKCITGSEWRTHIYVVSPSVFTIHTFKKKFAHSCDRKLFPIERQKCVWRRSAKRKGEHRKRKEYKYTRQRFDKVSTSSWHFIFNLTIVWQYVFTSICSQEWHCTNAQNNQKQSTNIWKLNCHMVGCQRFAAFLSTCVAAQLLSNYILSTYSNHCMNYRRPRHTKYTITNFFPLLVLCCTLECVYARERAMQS